ncbi:mitochondrial carrier homolog 2-like [Crassostrea virginica]
MTLVSSGVSAVIITALHPLGYAKVLIQLGHEPLAPYTAKDLLWRRTRCYYPSVFSYIKYIKRQNGFMGLYRGLLPRICEGMVGSFVTQNVSEYLRKAYPVKENSEDTGDAEVVIFLKGFLTQSSKEIVAKFLATIVSHPIHVIALRNMAEFVGNESFYRNPIVSVREIYDNEGLAGFFAGLVPRLLGDALAIMLINFLSEIVNRYFLTKKEQKAYTAAVCSLVVTQFTYPFELVSRNMSVKPARLLAAKNMPDYTGWTDCWSKLKRNGELMRGSNLLIRIVRNRQPE